MKVQDLLQAKMDKLQIKRSELVDVCACPRKPVPGIPQSWRHQCALCGEILADDTQQYDLTDNVFWPYWYNHFVTNHV